MTNRVIRHTEIRFCQSCASVMLATIRTAFQTVEWVEPPTHFCLVCGEPWNPREFTHRWNICLFCQHWFLEDMTALGIPMDNNQLIYDICLPHMQFANSLKLSNGHTDLFQIHFWYTRHGAIEDRGERWIQFHKLLGAEPAEQALGESDNYSSDPLDNLF